MKLKPACFRKNTRYYFGSIDYNNIIIFHTCVWRTCSQTFGDAKIESIALAISGLVSVISKLFAPIVWLLTASTNSILRLLGIDPNAEDEEITEDEIRMMANAGSEKGVIDHEENEIIQNLFEFDDMHADEIATHRTELDVLWTKDGIDKWHETITGSEHSYYPICDKTIDNIIGLLDARKYFILKNPTKDIIMEKSRSKRVCCTRKYQS